MSLHLIRRVAFTTVPLTIAVLGLTAGTASAEPRGPGYCQTLIEQANHDYGFADFFDKVGNMDNNAGRYDIADAEFALRDQYINDYYVDSAMIVAYGC